MSTRASTRLFASISARTPIYHCRFRTFASSATPEKPLYPSVELLLHTHNLSASDIKPTGPGGRILKGDVLAHLGSITSSYPKELSERLSKLSHLDLSNIKLADPKKADTTAAPPTEETEPAQEIFELSLPIDLKPVLKLQQRLEAAIGHSPPLSELITRAINLANIDLPAAPRPPTADELFEDIIGTSYQGSRLSDGRYIPVINKIEPIALSVRPTDIIDELIAPTGSRRRTPVPQPVQAGPEGAVNDFSIAAPPEERKRVTVFLQRMKSVLEIEPGRLVL